MNDIFTPSHLQSLCTEYNLRPSKRHGQNFLISPNPVKKMIEIANLHAKDTIVEIGPGFGALTLALAPKVDKVVAFEIEQKFRPYWGKFQSEYSNIDIVWGNALTNWKFGVKTWRKKYKVISNIPYSITSRTLRMFLEAKNKPKMIVVMVQKEVGQRICAKAGDMSLLSVSVQYYGNPRIVARVSRGNFWPEPTVDSVILVIDIEESEHASAQVFENEEIFFKVVKAGFANKRKQLWGNLSKGLHVDGKKIKEVLNDVVGNEKARAQELSIDEWRRLVRSIYGIG